ncbi:MAG: hypothetical protein AAF871_03625 [Pseudomonadota bacterium]
MRRGRAKGSTEPLPKLLSHALKTAWYDARKKIYAAEQQAAWKAQQRALEARSVGDLSYEIICLENKTVLGHDGLNRLSELKRARSVAWAREAAELPQAA